MGAKQSKRSVDITTTPKKGDGDNPVEGEGKVEKIADPEATKITTNGAIHTEIEFADKEENEKSPEDVKENGMSDSEVPKTPEGDVSTADELNETSDVAEKSPESAEKVEETAEGNKKNKDKPKKLKWSFRSISFSKKDKSKPSKDSKKNGDVKEEAEEGTKENATTPTAEAPKTINEDNVVEEMPITNGEATAEEIEIPAEVTEPVKEPESENPPKPIEPTEELKVELVEQPKETPVEIEPKSVVTVQIVEETIAEPAAPSTIKESKECNEVVLSTDNLPLENEVERHDAGGDNTENAEPVSAKVE